ncbi:MAG: hypothetical protein WBM04_07155 [Candidatus Korobacteraceae bacterium]
MQTNSPKGYTFILLGILTVMLSSVGVFPFQVTATDSSQLQRHQVYPYTINVVIGTDLYGDLTALPSPGGASGFFRRHRHPNEFHHRAAAHSSGAANPLARKHRGDEKWMMGPFLRPLIHFLFAMDSSDT